MDLMGKHNVEYADLSITSDWRHELAKKEGDDDHLDVHNRCDCVRIESVSDEQKQRGSARNPKIGTLEELKLNLLHIYEIINLNSWHTKWRSL